MKSFMVFMVVLGLGSSASAIELWDECSNFDGSVRLDFSDFIVNGDLFDGSSVRVAKTTVLKNVRETCTLANSGETVVAFENTVTLEELRYTKKNQHQTTYVVCERGGSQIPNDDYCK